MKNFKRRTMVTLLALLMVMTLFTPMAFATEHYDDNYVNMDALIELFNDNETEIELFAQHQFNDVGRNAWYNNAVQFVWLRGIMAGTTNTTFNPQGRLTRAEVTALLFRLNAGRRANAQDPTNNNFTDVNNEWFAPYVTWANRNGIVTGSDGRFNPNGQITRQEFATMVYRFAMNMTDLSDNNRQSAQWNGFTDRGNIASWATTALRWMNYHGIVTGSTNTTINPTGTATRAEAATMMMRLVGVLGWTINGHPPHGNNDGGNNQQPPVGNIDTLTQNGATWHQLQQAGFNRREIQGAFEREMFRLVNNIRRDHGLPLFVQNETIGNIARARAEESMRHNTMTHTSQATGLAHTEHFNAMTGMNVTFAGENLGGTLRTPQQLIQQWMDSAGHRAFILVGQTGCPWAWLNMNQVGFGFDFCQTTGGDHNATRSTLWLSTI